MLLRLFSPLDWALRSYRWYRRLVGGEWLYIDEVVKEFAPAPTDIIGEWVVTRWAKRSEADDLPSDWYIHERESWPAVA